MAAIFADGQAIESVKYLLRDKFRLIPFNRHRGVDCKYHSQGGHLLSAPEQKAQVRYWHVIRRSSVRPSLTFHNFDFFSETAERNSTKLDRKQNLDVLCQVCVFSGRS